MSNVPVQLVADLERHVGEHLLLEREQPLRADVESHPRLGGLDASPRAVEQLRPEPLLRAHAPGGSPAGCVTPRRSAASRERPALDDTTERCKLARVHEQTL